MTGALPLGSSVFDTATVTPTPGTFTPTGSVTYTFFPDNDCAAGTGTPAGTVHAGRGGTVPNSDTRGPLAAGSYSFQAVYSGDANFPGSTSACEPLTVSEGTDLMATVIHNAVTDAPVTGALPLGSSVFDTATVTPTPPTGSPPPARSPTPSSPTTTARPAPVRRRARSRWPRTGLSPNSDTRGPLTAGSYSFQAVYSGDTNFPSLTSACEPFTVEPGTSSVATQVNLAGTTTPIPSPVDLGSSVYDTATITHSDGFTPTGTVTYTFFTGNCTTGTVSSTVTVGVNPDGAVPNSNTQGPLAAGSYSVPGRLLAVTPTSPGRPAAASR